MKLAVIGCGLGYSLSWILQSYGHDVIGIDINPRAFQQPRLDDTMRKYIGALGWGSPRFTEDYAELDDRELIFIFVATPLINKRLSTHQVESALYSSLKHNNEAHYVLLSTMPIGGLDTIFKKFPKLKTQLNYVPPQIRAINFLDTFIHPPTNFQMVSDNTDYSKVLEIYKPILSSDIEFIITNYRVIEAAKLLINAFLTNKIVFANAVDDWCRQLKLDSEKVMEIVGKDPRVGNEYIKPDGAVGGSCLPRDVIELTAASNPSPFYELLKILRALNDERAERFPSPLPVKY